MNIAKPMQHASFEVPEGYGYDHVYLGEGHDRNERRTWVVIVLCGIMMLVEIVGGLLFGSIALVADGLHMSTHAGALLLAAMAYTFSRRYAHDPRFSFGTGKLGDLAGFTSAIVLAMIALLIGYESVSRFFSPVPIHFGEAIPIAFLGLGVNVVSAWLLSGGHDHHHGHGHSHGHGHDHDEDEHDHEHGDEAQEVRFSAGVARVEIFEDGVPPRFRLSFPQSSLLAPSQVALTTNRGGAAESFTFEDKGGYLESIQTIPEPHAFDVRLWLKLPAGEEDLALSFAEHDHGEAHGQAHDRDNNMRAAVVHVLADAAVSVLVITGLFLAKLFGWLWMDPVAGLAGSLVIASWSYGLIRDTGAILLDMTPDKRLAGRIRKLVEEQRDTVADLHLWRLGPGHLGAIVSVLTRQDHDVEFYRRKLGGLSSVSHLTVEVLKAPA
jgi:cation diffusion facilitator family transporter